MNKLRDKITAGLIIIGDEILNGITRDENSNYASRQLFDMGIHLDKISIIGDNDKLISEEVMKFSKLYTYVVTSGGIGPTHDDITYKSVAEAFNQPVEQNQIFTDFLKKYKPAYEIGSPFYKMAQVPNGSEIHFSPKKNKFPLVSVHNVYIMPGIPQLFKKSFEIFKEIIDTRHSELPIFYIDSIFLPNIDESSIADTLSSIINKYSFEESLKIGSYPEIKEGNYGIKLTVFSTNKIIFQAVLNELKVQFKPPSIINDNMLPLSHNSNSDKAFEINFDTTTLIEEKQFQETFSTYEELLKKYKYPDEIAIAFNGGKDCCLLLYLWLYVLKKKNLISIEPENNPLLALYIRQRLPFPELEEFIYESSQRYNLKLVVIEGSYKSALETFRDQYPQVKAILMGTRRTDPNSSNLTHFARTDPGWPSFTRVHPILDWTYQEVWDFIDKVSIPYCSLYDKGYTSLGSMDNTLPNPDLRYINEKGMVAYKPAKQLYLPEHERQGRKALAN